MTIITAKTETQAKVMLSTIIETEIKLIDPSILIGFEVAINSNK